MWNKHKLWVRGTVSPFPIVLIPCKNARFYTNSLTKMFCDFTAQVQLEIHRKWRQWHLSQHIHLNQHLNSSSSNGGSGFTQVMQMMKPSPQEQKRQTIQKSSVIQQTKYSPGYFCPKTHIGCTDSHGLHQELPECSRKQNLALCQLFLQQICLSISCIAVLLLWLFCKDSALSSPRPSGSMTAKTRLYTTFLVPTLLEGTEKASGRKAANI